MTKRSSWKGPFIKNNFFQEVCLSNKNTLKTTSRNSVVLPFLIGKTVSIHNGKFFIPIYINEFMVGHKLGEFVPTRLRHIYKEKKKNGTKSKSK
jgi:small subunit ribosomal protein S19